MESLGKRFAADGDVHTVSKDRLLLTLTLERVNSVRRCIRLNYNRCNPVKNHGTSARIYIQSRCSCAYPAEKAEEHVGFNHFEVVVMNNCAA